MVAGNEEHEPLISSHNTERPVYDSNTPSHTPPRSNGDGEDLHIESYAPLQISAVQTCIPIPPKSYGSLQQNGIPLKLTYTWSDLNVFTDESQRSNSLMIAYRKLKSRFENKPNHMLALQPQRKHLLKNVSGMALPGELLAILGSSGAGKTTLLNALACRGGNGVKVAPAGVRALNNIPVGYAEMKTLCAYVQQDDLFIGTLTPREHLIFQALVRMDRHIPYKQRVKRVEEVITELSLGKCQHTKIGVPGRVKGLSGGEMKRLSFASEALTDPPLLLCDEPTSGLDSFMAANVLQVLKGLASKGKTVVITIHQPSSELFSTFDKLLLMAEGRVAFLGNPTEASEFFDRIGSPCPPHYNPADLYIQALSISPSNGPQSRERVLHICNEFKTSDKGQIMERSCRAYMQYEQNLEAPWLHKGKLGGYKASWIKQFRAVLWRSWLSVIKEPLLVKVRMLQTIMVAFLIGIIYYGQKLDQDGVMNINGALFIFLTNMTFQNVFAVINVFCAELPVFLREHRSNTYRSDVYFLGKTIAELPLFCVSPALFVLVAYPLTMPQPINIESMLISMGIVIMVANVATSFGYLISCISNSVGMALSIGPPIVIPFLLFGGFFLNSGSVPVYFTWLSYLSWFRYGNEALLITQWSKVGEGEIACTRNNATCPSSGAVVLETLNFDAGNLSWDILGLLVLILLFRFLAYLSLCWKAKHRD